MTTIRLVTPYKDLTPEQKKRLNVDVSYDDFYLLQSVVPLYGFPSTIVSIILNHLANECRTNKWSGSESATDLISYIRTTFGSSATIARLAKSKLSRQATARNDRKRVRGVGADTKKHKAVKRHGVREQTLAAGQEVKGDDREREG